MRGVGRRIARAVLVVPVAVVSVVSSFQFAVGQAAPHGRQVFVFTIEHAGLGDLLSTSGFLALAQHGGASLLSMTHPSDATFELSHAQRVGRGVLPFWSGGDLGSMAGRDGTPSPEKLTAAAHRVARAIDGSLAARALVFVVSSSPPAAAGAFGDQLGAVVMTEGRPSDLVAAMRAAPNSTGPPHSLTSDSTRRNGVVTSQDLATTTISFSDIKILVNDPGGAEIRVVDAPPPTDLLARYLQYRRLTVPIGAAAALFVTIAGLVALAMLLWSGSSRWLRSLMSWVAIAAPFLALSLLLVGHLPSLTYAGVIPFLIATTALAAVVLVPIAHRWGTLVSIAVAGTMLLGALVVEGILGWSAALTPLLGGSQLDGGRYFGLPNAFIGLLLGGSVYVAQRLHRAAGSALIFAFGLFAGSPWTGSNIGAAVTLFAGAGIWWALDGDLTWWQTAVATALATIAGTGLVIVAHRYLTSAPTHITRFVEHTGGLSGIWTKIVDRLSVGTHLIASNPFALVPVIGVLGTLALVLRPPAQVRITFEEAPVWRTALLTILLGSVVAYLVNDSGAAAIGEGFTTAFGGLLYVSLLRRNGIMETS